MRALWVLVLVVGCAGDDGGTTEDSGEVLGVCAAEQICAPALPEWQGPVALAEACPEAFPTEITTLQTDLSADPATCACGCAVDGVSCTLEAWDAELTQSSPFAPTGRCDAPPVDDACLDVLATGSCTTQTTIDISPATWGEVTMACAPPTPTQTCVTGSCYPAAEQLCVFRDGQHSCPEAYPEERTWYREVADDRTCSGACTCEVDGASCEMELEICSVAFFTIDVRSDDALDAHCLNSGDGDGVTLNVTKTLDNGTCSASGLVPEGAALPTGPVTACCLAAGTE